MGLGGYGHWIIVLLIVLVLFGRGRISEMMGDFGKGIKSFKQGLNDDDKPAPPPAQIGAPGETTISPEAKVESSTKPQ